MDLSKSTHCPPSFDLPKKYEPISENINGIVIDFIEPNFLESLKETIMLLTDLEDLDIVVNDYFENTDLGI